MSRLLPLFPLPLVVFPGAAVPLHIFEDRYREMVGEAEARGTEFGMVRTMVRGEESGIVNTGCTVTVESVVNRYPDGRFDIIARGRRRFQIVSVDDERPYLRGQVEYFVDEPSEKVPEELVHRALETHERLRTELGSARAGSGETPESAEPERQDLSFRLAEDIDDLDFRSLMLQTRSEPERLQLFTRFAAEYIPRRLYAAHVKQTAGLNGSGHKRPGA